MSNASPPSRRRFGIFGFLVVAVGVGCLLVTLLGVVNTAFDLRWQLSVYGTDVDLPGSWEECIGLGAVGLLLVGLAYFGNVVLRLFRDAKGKPLVRVGILLGALALLVAGGRGLQLLALKTTYDCMLAYYATDGDLDDVRDELADGPDRACLDDAVSRAAQYDNAAALALLLEAGADFADASSPPDQRRCLLVGTAPAFIDVALAHGVKPPGCPGGEELVWSVVNYNDDDAAAAKTVAALVQAGWSAAPRPSYSEETALALARKKGMTATVAAIETASR